MDKQREAFKKWFVDSGFASGSGKCKLQERLLMEHAWKAAQSDKLEFARKVADRVLDTAYNAIHDSEEYLCNYDLPSVDVNSIIAKVGQEL